MLKNFSIFSAVDGLVTDQPSILLPTSATSDVQDMYFAGGEACRYQKRTKLFSDALPDAVIAQYTLNQASQSRKYYMYFTRRDIAYRDAITNRFVFVNKKIDEGTVSSVTTNTDGTHAVEIGMNSGFSLTDAKAGDFIRIGSGTGTMYADDYWLEIESVDSSTMLTCSGDLPSGYTVPTGGDDFVIRRTFSGTDSDIWVRDTVTGEAAVETLIATNNGIDFPIRWTGGANNVEDITDEFKCKWLNAFAGRVVAFNIVANGQAYPVNYRWSELLDETVWSGTFSTAGETALTDGAGYVVRGLVFRDYLYVIKSESIERIATDPTDIFYSKVLRNDLGTTAGHSFITTRDLIYFFCTNDQTFRRFDGFYDTIISKNQDPTIKNISAGYTSLIRGFFVNGTRQIVFSVPYAGSETPNKLMIVDVEGNNSWTVIDMECYSFGGYEVVSNYDWSTLPYEEWASWAWASWKANDGSTGTEFDVCTDSQGYVYRMNDSRLDDGEEYESYIVFETDLAQKGALPFYKRLLKIQFYTRDSGSGTLDVSIKRDLETEWVSAGAVALGGGRDINTTVLPVDFRAKTFKVKVSSTYDFQLVGMVFWFQPMGDR